MRCKQFIFVSLAGVVLAASLAGCGGAAPASSAAASSVAASSVVVSSSVAETALPDGVYTADFETDSSMFHTSEACNGKGTLTVENGVMTFHVSLASKKIVNLYPGLAADAEANKTAWLIPTVDTVTYADGTTEEVYELRHPGGSTGHRLSAGFAGHQGQVVRPHRKRAQRRA